MEKAKFASTQINIPEQDAAAIIAFGKALIPDEDLAGKGRELQPHVTLKYGVKEDPITLEKAVADFKPFELELGSVGTFPVSEHSEGAAPVIIRVKTDLNPIHDAIHAAMGAKEDNFAYTPHVTLGYVKPEAAAKFDGQPYEKKVSISSVTLSTVGEVQFHIPLGKSQGAAMEKFLKFIPLDLEKGLVEQPDGSLYVYGKVTGETPDCTNEVCDYATTKPLYAAKAAWQLKASSIPGMEPSLMPHRSMHSLEAIGKGVKLDFDDAKKTISMGFEVVDPVAIQKYKKGVFIGFSQGGEYVKKWADPVFKGCTRYTADPGEVSGVDSPCLTDALIESMKGKSVTLHKANGSIELVKLDLSGRLAKKVETAFDLTNPDAPKLNGVQYVKCDPEEATLTIGDGYFKAKPSTLSKSEAEEVADKVVASLIKAGIVAAPPRITEEPLGKAKTKRKGGKDLPASAFAYVGDPEDTATWKLPIHDKAHAANALARFDQTQGIPEDQKKKVKNKIVAAAKEFGIEVEAEKKKIFTLKAYAITNPEQAQAMWKSQKLFTAQAGGDVAKALEMQKSLWDVHDLTEVISTMAFVHDCLLYEREREGDFSTVPDDLKQVIEDLVQCYLALVEEEMEEIVAALGGKEAAMNEQELQKGLAALGKAAEHIKAAHAMLKAHHDTRMAIHKSHHDMMKSLAPEHSALHKAHFDSISGIEKAHHDSLHKAISGITGDTTPGSGPSDISLGGGTQGGYGGAPEPTGKAVTLEDLSKLLDEKVGAMRKELEAAQDEAVTGVLKAVFAAVNGEAETVEGGIGNREIPAVVKVHQTQPVTVSKDADTTGGGAPVTVKPTTEMVRKGLEGGDASALHALAKTIKPNPGGVPTTLSERIKR